MSVPKRVNELIRDKVANLSDHHGEKRVGGNIERHSEENISTALIHLTRKFSVGDIKLKKSVARRKGHAVQFSRVKGNDEQSSRVGIGLNLFNHLRNLVDFLSFGVLPSAPLLTVDWA